jgi:hypothetical protein
MRIICRILSHEFKYKSQLDGKRVVVVVVVVVLAIVTVVMMIARWNV